MSFIGELWGMVTNPSDLGNPTIWDMDEIKRCNQQIAALCPNVPAGHISTVRGQKHVYDVGGTRFRIVNGDTVIAL
jgi:hypothetical protein